MGNAVGSFLSGFGQLVDKILGHPLEFLSGKSCDTSCRPTWDFMCYIENFCVSHLLKLALVAVLVYFVLLFFYLLFNLGIFQCICHTICRTLWACCATYFSALNFCCTYLCFKLRSVKRTRRRRRSRWRRRMDVEEVVSQTSNNSSSGEEYELGLNSRPDDYSRRSKFVRRKDYKNDHLRKSLRPRNHRSHVKLSGNSSHLRRKKLHHHFQVTRSSRFSQKGIRRNGIHPPRKRVGSL